MRGLICQLRAQRIVHPIRKPRNKADEVIARKPGWDGAFRAICFVASLAQATCHGLRAASRISSRKAPVAAMRDLFRGSLGAGSPVRDREQQQHHQPHEQRTPHEPDRARQDVGIGRFPDAKLGPELRLAGRSRHRATDDRAQRAGTAGENDAGLGVGPILCLIAPTVGSVFKIADDGEGA